MPMEVKYVSPLAEKYSIIRQKFEIIITQFCVDDATNTYKLLTSLKLI